MTGARPVLVAMSGLPGAGKSTLAREVGRAIGAVVLAVDAVEAAMWRAGVGPDERVPTGIAAYAVVQTLAGELLDAGHTVIADAVNAVEPARSAWRDLAAAHGVPLRWLEVTCTDPDLHRRRLASRGTRYEGFREPSWAEVRERQIEPWSEDRLLLDSVRPLPDLLASAQAYITDWQDPPPSGRLGQQNHEREHDG